MREALIAIATHRMAVVVVVLPFDTGAGRLKLSSGRDRQLVRMEGRSLEGVDSDGSGGGFSIYPVGAHRVLRNR